MKIIIWQIHGLAGKILCSGAVEQVAASLANTDKMLRDKDCKIPARVDTVERHEIEGTLLD